MAYVAISSEGGLIPVDLLDRVATGDAIGQRADDFGLTGGRRLLDEQQSAFSDVCAYWDTLQRRLEHSSESRTTITRDSFVRPVLERLGFTLERQRSATAGGETFVIEFRAGEDPQAPPVQIVAIDRELDRKAQGERRSPHAAVQEYLNRSDSLWGLVTNGARVRLLRDSARASQPTYVELDLAAMVEGNLYSEFVILYRLLHRTRFPNGVDDAATCLLERLYQEGLESGGRVRDKLREGVEEALKALGNGFLNHPASASLREALGGGRLDAPAYYRQLLKLVYRLLFLFVAEERRLLFPAAPDGADRREVYSRYYSVSRLRARADRYFAEDRGADLWQGLLTTFGLFADSTAAARLGLAPLNGELFGSYACPDLEGAGCANAELLRAIRALSVWMDGRTPRRVNYAGLDVEELGSIYESLLDFHPEVDLERVEPFKLAAGSERRQTGSYYTPPDLVRELIEHALVPVMEERLAEARTTEEKERALLRLRVCDPASGSGHFLLAAARRLARELARIRTGEDEPAPEAYRHALRDVIRQCIYAVDKNPLAVDLCKVALWIEGHEPGLPLGFLDHHVKCGDSLVGVLDLNVLREGIPHEAYKRTEANQRAVATMLRKQNKEERAGQLPLGMPPIDDHLLNLAVAADEIQRLADDSVNRVAEKAARYEAARGPGSDWWADATACHLWTAPFFADFSRGGDFIPTTGTVRRYLANPGAGHGQAVGAAWDLGLAHRFFHWAVEFPDVMVNGGFDVILGNPPFMGGRKITEHLGAPYSLYLTTAFKPAPGAADLCAHMFRRAFAALRPNGHLGMVASNTISQGDTREGGLALITAGGGNITAARRFIKWPGVANVEVNLVAIRKGDWLAARSLDGSSVASISSRLDSEPDAEPQRLAQNQGKAFIGSYVLGLGFLLTPDEAQQLIARDSRNRDCLFPYLNGEDLNSRPDQTPSRWVIQFDERTEAEARSYPELWRIVEERVWPERREKDASKYPRMVHEWWKFWNNRQELRSAVKSLQAVIATARISEHFGMSFAPVSWLFNEKTIVFAREDNFNFALLQSTVHESWCRKHSSTLESRFNYAPSDCFETFAFPQEPPEADVSRAMRVASEYHEHRRHTMLARNLGLTKTYNLFHRPDCQDADIGQLRELHAEMDDAILACYGWADLDPGHGFHQNERGQTRYTISPEARREVLRRLLELNLRIAAEESAGSSGGSARIGRSRSGVSPPR